MTNQTITREATDKIEKIADRTTRVTVHRRTDGFEAEDFCVSDLTSFIKKEMALPCAPARLYIDAERRVARLMHSKVFYSFYLTTSEGI